MKLENDAINDSDVGIKIVDVETAKELRKTKHILFVHFFTPWCQACKEYKVRIKMDVLPLLSNRPDTDFIHVDVSDQEPYKWANSFEMVNVPATVVFVDKQQIKVSYLNNKGNQITDDVIIRGSLFMIREAVHRILNKFPTNV